jgi:ABC-2 type transport system permease protein
MSGRPSRAHIIAKIIAKDFRAFSRDKLFLFLSVLGLVFYVLIFWLVPSTVDESISLGIVETDLSEALERFGEQQDGALELVPFSSRDELAAVIAGDLRAFRTVDGGLFLLDPDGDKDKPEGAKRVKLAVGLAFPPDFVATTASGARSRVELLVDVQAPAELETAMKSFVRELAWALSGDGLPVTLPEERTIVLGEDRAGRQVPFRDRMRPMLALFMLMVEAMALATLIATEISARTVTAILSTPARSSDLLIAKTVFGTLLASSQALIMLVAVGAFTAANWHVLIITVLIGALLFSGCAMVAGSAGKDFMGTLFLSMAFILPLAIPAFAVLFPGQAGPIVQLMPSYGFIEVLLGVTAYAEPWSEQLALLGTSCAWVVVIVGIGMLVLQRKVNTL